MPEKDAVATDNTKLAAIMMVFGGKLCRHNPLEYCEIFESRDSFESGYSPTKSATFNFEPDSLSCKHLTDAYSDAQAEDKFVASLNGLDEQKKQLVLIAHSMAVARACRETLDFRDFLVKLVKSVPEGSKWEMIKGNGSRRVKFGKYASKELKDEFLNKL